MPHVTNVRELLQSHKILLDTCFAMHPGFTRFTDAFSQVFRRNPILIPAVVLWELRYLSLNAQLNAAAVRAMRRIVQMYFEKRAEIRFEKCDDLPDLVILRVALQHQRRRNIAVLTNDRDLMLDLRQIWSTRSIEQRGTLEVLRINGFTNSVCLFSDRNAV